jgi:hypothetical protein
MHHRLTSPTTRRDRAAILGARVHASAPERMRSAAVLALLAFASASAFAADAATAPTVQQLWISNSLAGVVAAGLGFVAGRSWAMAGIVVAAALAWAIPPGVSEAALAAGTQAFGARYPFHAQASSVLVPLLAAAGVGLRRTWVHGVPGAHLFDGPARMLEQRVNRSARRT